MQFMMVMFFAVRNANYFGLEIDISYLSIKDLNMFQKLSHGANDMSDIQIARGDLVEHRRKEEEVFAIDECYFNIRITNEGFV